MTDTKKPRPAQSVPTVAPAVPLTATQLHVAHLFALMDDRRQKEMLRYAAAIAQAFPRRAPPVLRIVKGGAE